jgi:hypothetical protein
MQVQIRLPMYNRIRLLKQFFALLVIGLLLLAGAPAKAGCAQLSRKPITRTATRKPTRPARLSVRKQPARLFAGSSGSA